MIALRILRLMVAGQDPIESLGRHHPGTRPLTVGHPGDACQEIRLGPARPPSNVRCRMRSLVFGQDVLVVVFVACENGADSLGAA
jgi:hypothetical protein